MGRPRVAANGIAVKDVVRAVRRRLDAAQALQMRPVRDAHHVRQRRVRLVEVRHRIGAAAAARQRRQRRVDDARQPLGARRHGRGWRHARVRRRPAQHQHQRQRRAPRRTHRVGRHLRAGRRRLGADVHGEPATLGHDGAEDGR